MPQGSTSLHATELKKKELSHTVHLTVVGAMQINNLSVIVFMQNEVKSCSTLAAVVDYFHWHPWKM